MSRQIYSFDNTCPVIYDNDSHMDVYADEFLLALSSAGLLDVRGFITTTTFNPAVNFETYELDFKGRAEILSMAARSGMRNIPPHFRGPSIMLKKPESGLIGDTQPIDTPGTRFVVEQARKASPQRPVVLVMGGPLTVAVDAWLIDPSIRDNLIVGWAGGTRDDMCDYNGWADPWAAFIALTKMKLVQFPFLALPDVPKNRLLELPDSEIRQWMIDKRLPHACPLPIGLHDDADIQAALHMLDPQYTKKFKRVSFDHWVEWSGEMLPAFCDDEDGNTVVAIENSIEIATREWWKPFLNPNTWNACTPAAPKLKRPFFASPYPIGPITRVEAEDFDREGEGYAYHKGISVRMPNPYRDTDIRIIPANDIPGGYNLGAGGGFCVAGMRNGDWIEYSLDVIIPGAYEIGVRVASIAGNGSIQVFMEGSLVAVLAVPATGGEIIWDTVWGQPVELTTGRQTMRLTFEGDSDTETSVNYIAFQHINQ